MLFLLLRAQEPLEIGAGYADCFIFWQAKTRDLSHEIQPAVNLRIGILSHGSF